MQTHTPVLIVGAGPTGLTLAAVLQRHGVAFRIIDKKTGPTPTSNALAIHAATLRLLDDLGLANTFIQKGYPIYRGRIHTEKGLFAKIDLSKIDSRYDFVLALAQSETEKLLETYLAQHKVHIEHNTALTKIEKEGAGYRVSINCHDRHDVFTTSYIIAADGYHSTVRQLTDLSFEGDEIPDQFVLADVTLQNPMQKNTLDVFYARQGILAVFPFNEHHVRLIADVPRGDKLGHEAEAILAALKTYTTTRSQDQIRIADSAWASSFWIHSKCLNQLRHENLFFCGDAAHVHSPVGGQGMNAGMQDAYNLGWKLALVIQGHAQPKILDSYNEERLPIAKNIVKQTDHLTRFLLARNPLTRCLRNVLLKPLLHSTFIMKKMVTHLSMLDTHYAKSSVIDYTSCLSNRSPQPGEMIPEMPLTGKNFWLLIFTGKTLSDHERDLIKNCLVEINHHYSDCINPCIITAQPLDVAATQIQDADLALHKKFNVNQPGLCLVRPDKYIAFCHARLNTQALRRYLNDVLLT